MNSRPDSFPKPRIAVLISGRGSNLQAIIDAVRRGGIDADLAVVISNNAGAHGLERAKQAGIETVVLDHRNKRRQDYDAELVQALRDRNVRFVCLAGFMRLLSPVFIDAFPQAILNIHPSLLPSFPGPNAQYQAWEHGVKWTGVTVHLVTAELDAGPIIAQEPVPVREDDDADTLAARILEKEHQLYPIAIQLLVGGGWAISGRRVICARG
jgi:phosphoribosylglycinamide formyltransferase-1